MTDRSRRFAVPHRARLPLSALRQGQRCSHGFLGVRPRCEACGLDYGFADAGDGPAVFVILIAGFVVVGCALIVEILYQPPFWLHALLWVPLILATTLAAAAPDEGPDDRAAIPSQGRRGPARAGRAVTLERARRMLIPAAVHAGAASPC